MMLLSSYFPVTCNKPRVQKPTIALDRKSVPHLRSCSLSQDLLLGRFPVIRHNSVLWFFQLSFTNFLFPSGCSKT